jgi:hypothetical protein
MSIDFNTLKIRSVSTDQTNAKIKHISVESGGRTYSIRYNSNNSDKDIKEDNLFASKIRDLITLHQAIADVENNKKISLVHKNSGDVRVFINETNQPKTEKGLQELHAHYSNQANSSGEGKYKESLGKANTIIKKFIDNTSLNEGDIEVSLVPKPRANNKQNTPKDHELPKIESSTILQNKALQVTRESRPLPIPPQNSETKQTKNLIPNKLSQNTAPPNPSLPITSEVNEFSNPESTTSPPGSNSSLPPPTTHTNKSQPEQEAIPLSSQATIASNAITKSEQKSHLADIISHLADIIQANQNLTQIAKTTPLITLMQESSEYLTAFNMSLKLLGTKEDKDKESEVLKIISSNDYKNYQKTLNSIDTALPDIIRNEKKDSTKLKLLTLQTSIQDHLTEIENAAVIISASEIEKTVEKAATRLNWSSDLKMTVDLFTKMSFVESSKFPNLDILNVNVVNAGIVNKENLKMGFSKVITLQNLFDATSTILNTGEFAENLKKGVKNFALDILRSGYYDTQLLALVDEDTWSFLNPSKPNDKNKTFTPYVFPNFLSEDQRFGTSLELAFVGGRMNIEKLRAERNKRQSFFEQTQVPDVNVNPVEATNDKRDVKTGSSNTTEPDKEEISAVLNLFNEKISEKGAVKEFADQLYKLFADAQLETNPIDFSNPTISPSMQKQTLLCNLVTNLPAALILKNIDTVQNDVSPSFIKKEKALYSFFVKTIKECMTSYNFDGAFALANGLKSGPITRLDNIFDPKDVTYVNNLIKHEFSEESSYKNYRALLNTNLNNPVIPLTAVNSKDITGLTEGNQKTISINNEDKVEEKVNAFLINRISSIASAQEQRKATLKTSLSKRKQVISDTKKELLMNQMKTFPSFSVQRKYLDEAYALSKKLVPPKSQ